MAIKKCWPKGIRYKHEFAEEFVYSRSLYNFNDSLFRNRLGFPLEPSPRKFVIRKEVVSLFPDFSMVLVDPLDFTIH